ncbi:hypothetical protein FA15DRAFT_663664 [Coprinopsis marcescibilis]|uniref:Mnn4-regulates the mannosylphosphorylation n=1 Tax=Coprinopsis marcescibilis TaxID=230819 RepID=A0A5C3LCV3_COPMA|nr:hypothetical protein FA15DRAFT_663664 [Coprinopsis marcescibilis]
MSNILRYTLRSGLLRQTPFKVSKVPLIRPPSLLRPPTNLKPTFIQLRTVASSVSGRPGSQTLEHAATNVKEELGNSATDLAKAIAGANMASDSVTDHTGDSFFGITGKIASQVPEPVLVLGLAGGLPYLGASGMTVYLARQAEVAASGAGLHNMDPGVAATMLDQALNFQVTYGAVMLSFLGALHWGFEMAAYGGHKGYTRLAIGTVPMIVAWSTLGMQPMEALCLQWLGFTGLWYVDAKATMAGWAPKWYSQYRFYLSILVGTCIIGSLAGTSYFGPVAGHGLVSHDLEILREQRRASMPQKHGMIPGPIEAVPANENEDHYTRIRRRSKEEPAQK